MQFVSFCSNYGSDFLLSGSAVWLGEPLLPAERSQGCRQSASGEGTRGGHAGHPKPGRAWVRLEQGPTSGREWSSNRRARPLSAVELGSATLPELEFAKFAATCGVGRRTWAPLHVTVLRSTHLASFPKLPQGCLERDGRCWRCFVNCPKGLLTSFTPFHLGPHQRVQMTGSGD